MYFLQSKNNSRGPEEGERPTGPWTVGTCYLPPGRAEDLWLSSPQGAPRGLTLGPELQALPQTPVASGCYGSSRAGDLKRLRPSDDCVNVLASLTGDRGAVGGSPKSCCIGLRTGHENWGVSLSWMCFQGRSRIPYWIYILRRAETLFGLLAK